MAAACKSVDQSRALDQIAEHRRVQLGRENNLRARYRGGWVRGRMI
jgi:hypothetical protein